jgi:sterol-4alpha-carboxylate 3-dehydrogenase (decarboxylating)
MWYELIIRYSPRDRAAMWRLADAYNKGQHKYQMGPNRNLVDYSYVGNVADAHLLAADRLASNTRPSIAGEVFFVTDGKPVPYWTLPHLVFRQLGFDGTGIVVLPKWLCLILAFFSELWARWVTGGLPSFPRFIVNIATQEQFYNINKVPILAFYSIRITYTHLL